MAVAPAMKKCPFCAESIQAEAIKCRYCQSFLSKQEKTEAIDELTAAADPEAAKVGKPAEDDGWEPAEARAKGASKKSPPPMLLKPEVEGGGGERSSVLDEARKASAEEEQPRSSRRILYAGSPSWRAFFNQYALVVIGALVVPFLALWIVGAVEAGTFAKVLAVVIPLGIAAVAFLAINVYRTSRVFRVTTTNIESEYGLLSKKIDVLELWRCRDVRYQQSLLDRVLRIAHIEIMTADVTTPQLCINGLPASRQLFEKIRDSIEIQRQARNVVGFVQ